MARTANHKDALSEYHYLAKLHSLASTSDLKHELVYHFPEIAAQIFYHFDDKEMAGMIVQDYSQNKNGELRQLAFSVRDVLQARKEKSGRLETILGMQIIPIINLEDPENQMNGDIENI